ncbi:hypothetical protein HR45_02885 [Shewanella mangrovi]|uniref:Glycosyl transferase family 28 C-terminal domain-containing protein n=1 Tax=Shewanella mangrovi TaxID=1515746 RepID=A0A094LT98_9GAMM|nr:hypothetical protein [Shewanella mangrovi]KFZ38408.1 hypothetical protein HR45_02885 [Shewanella mangrovi]
MTILYYAPGGGLGHLSRALKVMRYIGASGIVVTSPLTLTPPLPDHIQHLPIEDNCTDLGSLAGWLTKVLRNYAVSSLIVDSFPAGIMGELGHISLPANRVYVSRLLNWQVYQRGINAIPSYRQTWYCEWPAEDQEFALAHLTGVRYWLPLLGTPPEASTAVTEPGVLIIHSDIGELAELMPSNTDIPITLITAPLTDIEQQRLQQQWPQVTLKHQFPAYAIGWQYQQLRCAGGFNLVSEYLQHPGVKFTPLARTLDLQQLRLSRGIRGMLPPSGMPLLAAGQQSEHDK